MTEPSWDLQALIASVSNKLARRFDPRDCMQDDVRGTLNLYALDAGKRLLQGADDKAAWRLLYAAGRYHCESEKAQRLGYSLDDVAWYSPESVESLLPLALDEAFAGSTEGLDLLRQVDEGAPNSTLLAMVIDVRQALMALPNCREAVLLYALTPEYDAALVQLSEWLGGQFPGSAEARRAARAAQ